MRTRIGRRESGEMSQEKFAIGIDFGTESARAILLGLEDGKTAASAESYYQSGVIDRVLPITEERVALDPDWALQDPRDYLKAMREVIVVTLRSAGVLPEQVCGIGIDCTASSVLPVKADGTPLCLLPEFRSDPHSWLKLWKHHSAVAQAQVIRTTAIERGESWLSEYGGSISPESFFPKILETLDESPDVYLAADRFIEVADWLVWKLTGRETHNSYMVTLKALWSRGRGFPSDSFFAHIDQRLEKLIGTKVSKNVSPVGGRAGYLTDHAAAWSGLRPGTPTGVATSDGHAAAVASGLLSPNRMVMTIGTSICHFMRGQRRNAIPGICGCTEDDLVPGSFLYEAGQPCAGDSLAWFVRNYLPAWCVSEATRSGMSSYEWLEHQAAALAPGESGLLALDWWNGNRSVLASTEVSGLIVGATLSTDPRSVYRALIEATAFGTRMIIETFEQHDMHVGQLAACGGLASKSPLALQIFSDVAGRKVELLASAQASAFGSAMLGAMASRQDTNGAGREGESAAELIDRMHCRDRGTYLPVQEHVAIYDRLFAEYARLYDYFGRTESTMKVLRSIRDEAITNRHREADAGSH